MKKAHLVAACMSLLALTGCGMDLADTPMMSGSQPAALQARILPRLAQWTYEPVSFAQMFRFWIREVNALNHERRVQLTGYFTAVPPQSRLDPWEFIVSDPTRHPSSYEYASVYFKHFWTRASGEAFASRLGAAIEPEKPEVVTVFLTIKRAERSTDRVQLDAVKRASGNIVMP